MPILTGEWVRSEIQFKRVAQIDDRPDPVRDQGRFPGGRWKIHRNDDRPMFIGKTKNGYPKPDGKYIFDKLSSVFISGNATRDDAPNHIRVKTGVPREIAETGSGCARRGCTRSPRMRRRRARST